MTGLKCMSRCPRTDTCIPLASTGRFQAWATLVPFGGRKWHWWETRHCTKGIQRAEESSVSFFQTCLTRVQWKAWIWLGECPWCTRLLHWCLDMPGLRNEWVSYITLLLESTQVHDLLWWHIFLSRHSLLSSRRHKLYCCKFLHFQKVHFQPVEN